jgi:putative flippase GtrA
MANPIFVQLAVYALVGGGTAVIYFLGIAFATETLALRQVAAVSLAYAPAVSFHFFANRKFAFSAARQPILGQGVRYGFLLVINYLITASVVWASGHWLGWSVYLGAGLGIVVTFLTGFFISRTWVFK